MNDTCSVGDTKHTDLADTCAGLGVLPLPVVLSVVLSMTLRVFEATYHTLKTPRSVTHYAVQRD